MRLGQHKFLIFLLLALFTIDLKGQSKVNKDEISDKDRIKFERLFIDAGKAKILEDYEQSIKLYEACIKIDPLAAAPYYVLGNLYMYFNEQDVAAQYSKKATEIDPSNYYYRLLYTEILKNNQQVDLAEEQYKEMMTLFPGKMELYIDLAMIYVFKKEYKKAIGVYDKLEEEIGPNEDIKLKKQYLYIQLGDVQRASKEIEDLIILRPDNPEYYILLAEVYLVNGFDEKALKAYNRASEKFPDNSRIQLSIAEYYRGKGEYEKAIDHLKIAFADPLLDVDNKIKTILSFFDLAERDEKFRNALVELGQVLLKTHPENARVLTINGDISLAMGKSRLARDYFSAAVELDNSRYPIWNQLLFLEAELDMFDTLARHSEQAIDLFPNQPFSYYFLGYANVRMKKYKEAAEAYESGVSLVLDNGALKVQFYLGMADAFNELKNYEKSDRAFDEVLKLDSNNTIALNNYSYYLSLREEKLEMALKMSAKCNNLDPNQSTYLDTYAWIFYKLTRYEEARIWMEKALQYGGNENGVILEHMGDIYFRLNNIEEAVNYWQKAKTAGEASELIDKKISDIELYE